MNVTSVKVQGYSCFKSNWIGFDQFMPTTVIIGRNNTGKSRLLEFVSLLTERKSQAFGWDLECCGKLDEEFLQRIFKNDKCGFPFGPNYTHYHERYSHWNEVGRHLVGLELKWFVNASGRCAVQKLRLPSEVNQHFSDAIRNAIETQLIAINNPLYGHKFLRILADRDITEERASGSLRLLPNGTGATQIVHRYILNMNLDESLVQKRLLAGLQEIFGEDGNFDRLEIREVGAANLPDGDPFFEIFLGEPKKGLIPLSESGSGLKTVILVLLNLLVMPNVLKMDDRTNEIVFAFEELENNLHPALLRRLFRYLATFVSTHGCHLFLTTHSSVALDFFSQRSDAQIIQVSHDGEAASASRVTAHFDSVKVLVDLGCKPADLLQANGVVWVEGPSDRVYINYAISLFSDGELIEGRDYQCAYYGGSTLANVEFVAPEDSKGELSNLLRLNVNVAVVCDRDLILGRSGDTELKQRVRRIRDEVSKIPSGHTWITGPKEIENYIPGKVWGDVYGKRAVRDPSKNDKFPTTPRKGCFVFDELGRHSFDKVAFAQLATRHITRESLTHRFDFEQQIHDLIKVIRRWNQ